MAKRKSMKRGIQRVDVTLYGDEFMDLVEEYGDEALGAAAEVVLREADRRVPKGKTGNLARSGYATTRSRAIRYGHRSYGWRQRKKVPKGGAVIQFLAPHAHLIESGRRKQGVILPRKSRGKRALSINGLPRASSRYNRMSSRPFLGPALDATRETMVEELAKVLRSRLEQEGQK